jgi:hypothetical protein
MGIIGKDFKFKLVKNFCTPEECQLLTEYMKLRHLNNNDVFEMDKGYDIQMDTAIYADSCCEALLQTKLDRMQKETGLNLLPTYAYFRFYTKHAYLQRHKDRNACEVSVSIFTGSDGTPYPFIVEDQEFVMEPGDAVIYLGRELEHERKEFIGDWHAQIFMHYVNENGPFSDEIFDKRGRLGVSKK